MKSFAGQGDILTDISASAISTTTLAVSGDSQITGSLIVSGCISASCFQVDTLTARTTIEMTQSLHTDDYPVYFGTNSDSFIKYDEAASDFMIISGSAKGLVISGSTVSASCDDFVVTSPYEGGTAQIKMTADQGDDTADTVTLSMNSSNAFKVDNNSGQIELESTYITLDSTLGNIVLSNANATRGYLNTNLSNTIKFNDHANTEIAHMTTNTFEIQDDIKLGFGDDANAYIKYDETGDDFMVISGSANGIVISGSAVKTVGQLHVSGNSGGMAKPLLYIENNRIDTTSYGNASALHIHNGQVDQNAIRIPDARNTNQPIIYMESSTTAKPFIEIHDNSSVDGSERFCIDIDIDHSSARAGGLKIKTDAKGAVDAILVQRNPYSSGAGAGPGDMDADDYATGIRVELDHTPTATDGPYASYMAAVDIDVKAGEPHVNNTIYAIGQRITMDGEWPADSSPGTVTHTGLQIGMKDSQYMTHIELLSGSAATGTLGINKDDFMVISGSNNGMVLSGSTISASCDMFMITGSFRATHHHSSSVFGHAYATGYGAGDQSVAPTGPYMFGYTDDSPQTAGVRAVTVVDISGSTSGSRNMETFTGLNTYVQSDTDGTVGVLIGSRASATGSRDASLGYVYGSMAHAEGGDQAWGIYATAGTSDTNDVATAGFFMAGADTANMKALETNKGNVVLNEGGYPNSDFRVESDDETHMLFVDAGNNRVSIGDSVDDPAATLEITNNASAGAYNVPLLQLNSNDVDQIALDINAANTTANVIDITADALTTGKALNIVSDASNTSARQLVSIKNDHASATGATALYVQNDSTGDGISVLAETNTFMSLDANKPYFYVLNAANDATGPNLIIGNFRNGGGTANSDNDGLGAINFYGYNDAGTPEVTEFAHIRGSVSDASDGTEDGILQLSASHMSFTGTTIKIDSHAITIGSNEKLAAGYSPTAASHPLMSGDFIHALDNAAMFFGTNGDAWMLYDETHSDQLVISGAVGGTYFSGSSVHVGGAGTNRGQTTYSPAITMPQTAFDTITDFGPVGTLGDAMGFYSDNEGGGDMVRFGTFDSNVTKGAIISYSSRVWFLADRSDNTGPSAGLNWMGIAMDADSGADEGLVLLKGFYRIPNTAMNNYSGTGQVGMPVYLSTTAGEFDMSVSTTSGDIIRVVGYLADTDGTDHLIYFCPDNTWVEVA